MDRDVPLELAEKVKPSDLEVLAQVHGWKRMGEGLPGVGVLRRDDDPAAEILLPEDRTFLDYAQAMAEAVKRLADSINRPPREVLSELLLPAGDLLRFRVSNPTTETGFLAFPAALELLQSCKQSLMAAAAARTALEFMAVEAQREELATLSEAELKRLCRCWACGGQFEGPCKCRTIRVPR